MSLNNFLLAAVSLTLTACNATKGSGNKITEERKVDDFSAISLDCSVDLTVEVGPEKSVSVWADDNLIDMVTTRVSGGQLIIDMEGNYMTSGGLKATVTLPELKSITNTGSGDITVVNPSSPTFTATLSGSGDLLLENLESESFTATVAGSGNLLAKGKVETLDATLSRSGDLDTGLTFCKNARAVNSGSGDLKVNASKTLDATLSGSGGISSIGKAKVTSNVTGSGKLTE